MNYDSVAPFYDRLSRMVFGKALLLAQLFLLEAIPAGSKVLIAGGGSGWILEAIAVLHPAGLNITYIDASAKMVALAKKRNAGANEVTFITAYVEEAALSGQFDVVITPFFFDNFSNAAAGKVFGILDGRLKKNGAWLYCDFRNTESFGQRILLAVMYRFFRVCCGIEARSLPDMATILAYCGYRILQEQTFMNGFVDSVIYKKGNFIE